MSGFVVLLLAGAAYFASFSRSPHPPAISTTGLDPAVAQLIEGTVREVRAAPRSGEGWGRLGSVLMHYEFIREARFAFDQAEKFSPEEPRWPYLHGILLMPHETDAVGPKLERAVERCRDQPDMPRLRLAQFLAERGRTAEAELHLQALLRLRPNHPMALLEVARLRHAQGRPTESTNLLSACLNDPHTAKSAHALLATVEQALGNGPAAEAAARRSADLPSDAPWPDPFWGEAAAYRVGKKALLEDASAWLDQGRVEEALLALNTVTRQYPQDDEAWYLMGWAFNRQQRGAESERALREHLARSPRSPKGHAQLAIALLAQQRYAEAVEVLEAGVKLKPTWREFHSNLGYACVQLGRHDEAIGHFRNALAFDPNYLPTYTGLAELLSRRGDNGEASRLLRQALELHPEDSRSRAMLQRIQERR
jgi:tetratricopeptide (TPR) repeat protein